MTGSIMDGEDIVQETLFQAIESLTPSTKAAR
jgi:DNA-directed RNA polymerase specialized sigma24 family protein